MNRRLKILMSAYACEPGKGSEPEVGWQWALQMSRFHDVTVLTRANNRTAIEGARAQLAELTCPPRFVYHDLAPLWTKLKKRLNATQLYYIQWQRSARARVSALHREHRFDLLHHTTFASCRYPIAITGHGTASLWGPVGGMESVPVSLLSWRHPLSVLKEIARNASNAFQSSVAGPLRGRASACSKVLASTEAMQRVLRELGIDSELMPTIGMNPEELPFREHSRAAGPLRIVYAGNLMAFKGLALVIEAMHRSGTDSTLTLIGSGDQQASLEDLARRLGLASRVRFLGRLPRADVLRLYPDYDLSVFLSLRDTGGYAVLESMLNELPVICFDCGGPALAVQPECGIRIPVTNRDAVVNAIASALRFYDQDRTALRRHGKNARAAVLTNYSWENKAREMDRIYQATTSGSSTSSATGARVR